LLVGGQPCKAVSEGVGDPELHVDAYVNC
jgi:hypothetical protein